MFSRETLDQTEFLRDIPVSLVPQIVALGREVDYAPGTVLFSEGEVHSDFQVILRGHVRLEMAVPQRGRVSILTAGPGDVLAWSALLAQGKMTATGIALESVQTACFDGQALHDLCEQQPELGYHLMKQLAAAISRRLLATRLQLLDLFHAHEPVSPVISHPAVGLM